MRRANIISGVVLAVFGMVMLFVVIPWQIAPGPAGMMSPSLVPSMMMIVVAGLSLLLVVNNLIALKRNSGADTEPPISRKEFMALIKIGGIFALTIALYIWLSPIAAGAALVIGALLVLGERRPLIIILMPAAFLFTIWFVFYKVLGTAIV